MTVDEMTKAAEPIICPVCGGKSVKTFNIYHDCGHRGKKQPPPPSSGAPPRDPRICKSCGQYRYDTLYYCTGCRTSMVAGTRIASKHPVPDSTDTTDAAS